jgi:RNA polymerase sigma factor (sigma-70 family)
MAISNASTLSELLIRERKILLSLIGRIVGNREAAEDVTQVAWLRIQDVEDAPPISNPRAYLYRLVFNLARDRLRGDRRRNDLQARTGELLWGNDNSLSPERIVASADILARVRRAAELMDEPTRTIFRLNRFEGLSQREIANRLNLSTTSVENHIKKALSLLARVRDGGDL